MTPREWWKEVYRRLRIARRETLKANRDCMLFGTGLVWIGEDGLAKHVPIEDAAFIVNKLKAAP